MYGIGSSRRAQSVIILGTALPIKKAYTFTAQVGFTDLSHWRIVELVLPFSRDRLE